jgi:hypothetical protein
MLRNVKVWANAKVLKNVESLVAFHRQQAQMLINVGIAATLPTLSRYY